MGDRPEPLSRESILDDARRLVKETQDAYFRALKLANSEDIRNCSTAYAKAAEALNRLSGEISSDQRELLESFNRQIEEIERAERDDAVDPASP